MSSWAEVVEPSTRALMDDDSEEEFPESHQIKPSTRLELKWIEEKSSEIGLFIIAHGKLSTSFVTRFVCDERHDFIAEVQENVFKEALEKEPLSDPLTKTTSPIYRVTKNICICLCADIDMENANKFRNAILPLLQKSSQIVVVSAQKSSSYLHDRFGSELTVPFVRCLFSSTYKFSKIYDLHLEQPNIVTGVPAAILSWCEVFNVPGILYCCYTDTNEVDSISTIPLIKIFSTLSTEILDPRTVKFKKESYRPVTNLYM